MMGRFSARRWQAAYRRQVASAFRTVPLYRERWALDGRSDPVLVPGRTGTAGGAITVEEARRRMADLVPLGGGARQVDPHRGLGSVLATSRPVARGTLVLLLDEHGPGPLADLPRGTRGRVLAADTAAGHDAVPAIGRPGRRSGRERAVIVIGTDEDLARMAASLPRERADGIDRIPRRGVGDLGRPTGPGLIHDRLLGYLGGRPDCGCWHLDWRRVYARETSAGIAFTLLLQRSPRLVDIVPGGGAGLAVAACPEHRTPVIST